MSKIDRSSKSAFVALGSMRVAEMGQRDLRPHRVDKLVTEFDINRLGMPVVNKRDGFHFIMDGQHRVAALKQWNGPGWETIQIECQVFDGLTEQDEAEMFLRLNDVLQVSGFDKFRKAVVAGRPVEVAVKKCVERQGLSISKRKSDGTLSCVSTLVNVFERSGATVLERSLRIMRDAYGQPGFEALVLDGIAHLCARYNGVLDEQTAKQRLGDARGGVKGLLNRATAIQLRTGEPRPICVAAAAVDIINGASGRAKKLPDWWKGADHE